jgi:tetratricopeptide (TPR) repeat protein
MLRLRRAEAPVKWRAEHSQLAAANATWASPAAGQASIGWAHPDWVDYTREETYHLLCADPHGNLPGALASAVIAADHSVIRARQWAALIADAGRDTNNDQLTEWGERLTDGILDGDLSPYLTCLINDANRDTSTVAVALKQRGEAYRLMRRYDDALTDLNRAIEARPDQASAIGSRGETYRATRRYDEGLADFNRAIELIPSYVWGIGSRGQTYRQIGRYDETLADFNLVIELRPSRMWAIGSRGETYRLVGRYDEALADLSCAIEYHPNNAWAIGRRGQTLQAMGRYDQALNDLNRAIELDPSLGWAIASRDEISSRSLT